MCNWTKIKNDCIVILMKREIFFIAAMTTASLTSACGNENTPKPVDELVIQGSYEADGSNWAIECYGPIRFVKATYGDALLKLVLKNVELVQPVAINRKNIPQEVFTQAIADINDIRNPDAIAADKLYAMPSRCQTQ